MVGADLPDDVAAGDPGHATAARTRHGLRLMAKPCQMARVHLGWSKRLVDVNTRRQFDQVFELLASRSNYRLCLVRLRG